MPNPRSESKTTRLRVYCANRDGWLCYRCIQAGRPVDQQRINPHLRYPHPMSVSLEHVLGDDTLTNNPDKAYDPRYCTVSHLAHNRTAGARLGGQRSNRRYINTAW